MTLKSISKHKYTHHDKMAKEETILFTFSAHRIPEPLNQPHICEGKKKKERRKIR